jgi:hypothetical protein
MVRGEGKAGALNSFDGPTPGSEAEELALGHQGEIGLQRARNSRPGGQSHKKKMAGASPAKSNREV